MYQTIFSEIFKVLNLRENRYDFEMIINKDAYKGKCEVCGAAAPVQHAVFGQRVQGLADGRS